MRTRLQLSSIVIVALLLCLSCTRPSFTLMGIHTGVSRVSHYDREGELTSSYESLSVFVESEEDANLQMEVSSPDGQSSWLFPAKTERIDKIDYYGKASLSLGEQMPLPRGEWSLRVMRDDGRTITESFVLEAGTEAALAQHLLDSDTGTLILPEQVRECAIQLLDVNRRVLHRSTTTEQTIALTSLYTNWDKVRSVGLSWYDEGAKQSQIVWYSL